MKTRPDLETTDERLARLRRATDALAPRGDFTERVGAALDARAVVPLASRRGLARVVLPFGRGALVAAALAAAASVALAIQSDRMADEAAELDLAWWEP